MFKKYAKFYDSIYGQKNYEAEVENLKSIFNQIRLGPSKEKKWGKVLEIGCGTGGHARHFLNDCLSYTGLDLSGEMIEQASIKCKGINTPTSFFICNLAELNDTKERDLIFQEKKFDLGLSLFHVFSYLTKDEQIDCFFKNVHHLLESDGIFIFDFWNREGVNHLGLEKRSKEITIPEGRIVRNVTPVPSDFFNIVDILIEVRVFDSEEKLVGEFLENHPMRMFTPEEVVKKVEAWGFKLKMMVGEGKNDSKNAPDKKDWGALAAICKV